MARRRARSIGRSDLVEASQQRVSKTYIFEMTSPRSGAGAWGHNPYSAEDRAFAQMASGFCRGPVDSEDDEEGGSPSQSAARHTRVDRTLRVGLAMVIIASLLVASMAIPVRRR
jgi:hypothetical protein